MNKHVVIQNALAFVSKHIFVRKPHTLFEKYALSADDLAFTIQELGRGDEIGEMAVALEGFKENKREIYRLNDQQKRLNSKMRMRSAR
ncbi:MAG: hypothetical protein OIF56_06050 [Cohaesibacter sp.]|nr:hypothetical protein [Cohaesibacter sp.]MCV6601945.1 hypothetical protein [Cohaesibacter sp.]